MGAFRYNVSKFFSLLDPQPCISSVSKPLNPTPKFCDVILEKKANCIITHMGSFPHQMQYFAAAGENDDFVIAVFNFLLKQYL